MHPHEEKGGLTKASDAIALQISALRAAEGFFLRILSPALLLNDPPHARKYDDNPVPVC